jgi:hypothetical protein
VTSGTGTGDAPGDIHLFTHENLLEQLSSAPFQLGAYTVRFYADNGRPANRVTPVLADFYLYPSGGTLRDSAFNLVFYDSRYDTYRGFIPPHSGTP